MMFNLIKKILKREYQFLNVIELNRDNLLSNYRYLSSLDKQLQIAPVLKSNAYGHGLVQIGQMLDTVKVPFLCVDSLHEAYRLQQAGIKTPILIMGYVNPENLKFKRLPFHFVIYDLHVAEIINRYQPQAKIHIKVDTGMHRLGVPVAELDQFLRQLRGLPNIQIEGLISHFASAHSLKDPLFQKQLTGFKQALAICKKHNLPLKWKHLSATEALLNPETRKEIAKVTNLARAGKAIYGYALNTDDAHLKPVLKLKTHIAQIKQLQKGDTVGYDGTFTAKKATTIAVLPIGYNDGVDRRLSNKGTMQVNGKDCPIIGRVSMNISTIDISQVEDAFIGQEVVVISDQKTDCNSLQNFSIICDTIAHELLVHLEGSTKRIIT